MKSIPLSIASIFIFILSCKQKPQPLVEPKLINQMVQNLQSAAKNKVMDSIQTQMKEELNFWESRIVDRPEGITALKSYTNALIQDFHLTGNIFQLQKADSILLHLNQLQKEQDAGILRSLASLYITLHRFTEANEYIAKARKIGTEKYATELLFFDTQFELGGFALCKNVLSKTHSTNQFGYLFRMAKWKHYLGETDSAIHYFNQSALWAGNSNTLKQAAYSNLADLYLHEGNLEKAYSLYKQNLIANPYDHYSLQGMGRIALSHPNTIKLAEKIFYLQAKVNALPDALYNLVWLAEAENNIELQKKYATEFEKIATQKVYGGMYNKYLIELYTGILNTPSKALILAEKEILNRSTPQTNAWLVYALQLNGKTASAKSRYQKQVSGKPLESLELYWMGKTMELQYKKYNAKKFYKAAARNRYDLSPAKQKDL